MDILANLNPALIGSLLLTLGSVVLTSPTMLEMLNEKRSDLTMILEEKKEIDVLSDISEQEALKPLPIPVQTDSSLGKIRNN